MIYTVYRLDRQAQEACGWEYHSDAGHYVVTTNTGYWWFDSLDDFFLDFSYCLDRLTNQLKSDRSDERLSFDFPPHTIVLQFSEESHPEFFI